MVYTGKRLRLCLCLLALNIGFIWGNSLLPGEISGAISNFVKSVLSQIFGQASNSSSGSGWLRKVAHFTEFATLGICLQWLVGMLRERSWRWWAYPLLLGLAVASMDEAIQIVVPMRGPSLWDVALDTCGVIFGIFSFRLVYYLRKRSMIHTEECEL